LKFLPPEATAFWCKTSKVSRGTERLHTKIGFVENVIVLVSLRSFNQDNIMKWIRFSGVVSLLLSVTLFVVYIVQSTNQQSAILWLPIALFMALGVTNLIFPWWQSRKKVDTVDTFFAKYWPQTRAIHAVIFIIGLSAGLFLFGLVFWQWGNNTVWGTTFFVVLVSASITLGLYHLQRMRRYDNLHYTTLRDMLHQKLQDVMWVYEMPAITPLKEVEESETPCPSLYFWLSDNTVQRILVPESVIRPLFKFIQEHAPHISIGYDPEQADIVHTQSSDLANHE
jgi:hypothetical protein